MLGALFVLCRLQAFLWFSDTQSQISEKIDPLWMSIGRSFSPWFPFFSALLYFPL